MSARPLGECIRIDYDDLRVVASMTVKPGYPSGAVVFEALRSHLENEGIDQAAIRSDAIESLVSACATAPGEPHTAVVASGTPPRASVDGRFEWSERLQQELARVKKRHAAARHHLDDADTASEEDTDEEVDFYSQSAFVIIHKGEVVGRYLPPSEGAPGVDVFGEEIVPPGAKPAHVTFDKHFLTASDGAVRAAASGRLLQQAHSNRILTGLQVDGDVDFSIGNIDFPGDVLITGGVRDRFVVRATGSIRIHGPVDAATIDAGRHLHLDGGMAARDRGHVRAGTDLNAKYLDDVNVNVEGACTISRELTNCRTVVGKRFDSPGCVVRGGTLTVARRCDVAQLGSPNGGVATEVVLGHLPSLDPLIAEARDLRERLRKIGSQAGEQIEAGESGGETEASLDDTRKLLEGVDEKIRAIESAMDRIWAIYERYTLTSLTVRRHLYPGTTIWVRGYRIEVRNEIGCPVIIEIGESGLPQMIQGTSGPPVPMGHVARVVPDERIPHRGSRVTRAADAA